MHGGVRQRGWLSRGNTTCTSTIAPIPLSYPPPPPRAHTHTPIRAVCIMVITWFSIVTSAMETHSNALRLANIAYFSSEVRCAEIKHGGAAQRAGREEGLACGSVRHALCCSPPLLRPSPLLCPTGLSCRY